ncbi:sugar transporter [Sulfurospirillum deleyianum]
MMFLRFHTSLHAWLPIMGLSICAFIFNTTEFAPISLLTTIATDFNISEAQTGMMMTIYAWIVATISLPLMLLSKNVERKSLLLGILFFFILSHLLSAFAWNYTILMLSRIGIAFSHAIFWAITASLVYRLAPKGQTTKALSFLATGSALAIVLGLPLGRIIGQAWGWRSTFGVIALLGVLMFYFLFKTLPTLPSQNAGSLKSLPILMKRPALMGTYLLTILAISAHFTAYSYIEPFVIHVAHLGERFATAVLFLFGIAGLLGSMLFARLRHKHPFGLVLFALSALIFAEAFMMMLSFHVLSFSILSLFWGIAICLISLILQVSVLELAPDATDVAMSLYSGIYNIGIGGGAFIGGWVINSLGMQSIGYVGALFGALALSLAIWIWKRYLIA